MVLRHYVFRPRDGFRFQQGEQIIHGGYCYDVAGCVGSHFVDWHGTLFHVYDLTGLRITSDGLYGAESLRRVPVTPPHQHITAHHHRHHPHITISMSTPTPVLMAASSQTNTGHPTGAPPSFHDRHRRAFMAVQGVLDLAGGSAAGYAAVVTVMTAAGVTTLGVGFALGAAAIAVYGIFRASGSLATSGTELVAASTQTDEQLKETEEKIEHFKTLSSLSSYASLGYDHLRHQPGNWKRAGYFSDGEGFISGIATGAIIGKAPESLEEATKILRIARYVNPRNGVPITRTVIAAKKVGEHADQIDKFSTGMKDFWDFLTAVNDHRRHQEDRRNRR
jgi:hypothetical protein